MTPNCSKPRKLINSTRNEFWECCCFQSKLHGLRGFCYFCFKTWRLQFWQAWLQPFLEGNGGQVLTFQTFSQCFSAEVLLQIGFFSCNCSQLDTEPYLMTARMVFCRFQTSNFEQIIQLRNVFALKARNRLQHLKIFHVNCHSKGEKSICWWLPPSFQNCTLVMLCNYSPTCSGVPVPDTWKLYVWACQSQLERLQRGASNTCFKEQGTPEYHEQIATNMFLYNSNLWGLNLASEAEGVFFILMSSISHQLAVQGFYVRVVVPYFSKGISNFFRASAPVGQNWEARSR